MYPPHTIHQRNIIANPLMQAYTLGMGAAVDLSLHECVMYGTESL